MTLGAPVLVVLGAGGRVGRLLERSWALHPPRQFIPIFHTRNREPGPARIFGDLVKGPMRSLGPRKAWTGVLCLAGVTKGNDAQLAQNATTAAAANCWAKAQHADLFLYASSQAVYVPDSADLLEDSPTRSYGYGGSKSLAECTLMQNCKMPTVILRMANVVGADSLSMIFDKDVSDVTLDRYPNGAGPLRSFVSPFGLSKLLEQLVEAALACHPLPNVLNFGSTGQVAMADLIKAADKNLKWTPAIDASHQRIVMNMNLTQATLGRLPKAQATRLWSETKLVVT